VRTLAGIVGSLLLLTVLAEGFSTFVLARRAPSAFKLTRAFYRITWSPYAAFARRIDDGRRRENFLAVYGPLSLLGLLGCLAVGLIASFGLLQWAVGVQLNGSTASLAKAIFLSGTSLFTVGSEEPANPASRVLMVLEAGVGLSFLGLLVGYLPVLYQSYSKRELRITLLDAHAGSPPSAAELLLRHGGSARRLESQLQEWEVWAAELLQHQLSYPMLAYFRSQHVNESWLSSLTVLLDASAILILCTDGDLRGQAEDTFAMGRHAIVDMARIFGGRERSNRPDRLLPKDLSRLRGILSSIPGPIDPSRLRDSELSRLRELYEPFSDVLSLHLLTALPSWVPEERSSRNWSRTGWEIPVAQPAVSDPFREA
jgi:Tfp pilus assembly protein PilN